MVLIRNPATYSADAALRKAERKGPQYDDELLQGREAPPTRLLLEGGPSDWEYEIREYEAGERNPVVFLDMAIAGDAIGRLEVTLRDDVAPKTCENFRALCTGERSDKLWYKGCKFHRVIPDFAAQGGDFEKGNGSGGVSIYGDAFEDEGFDLKHDRKGVVAMATTGNTSQFFITLKDGLDFLDGKHVVFGFVSEGLRVLDIMQSVGTTQGKTREIVSIANCGQLQ